MAGPRPRLYALLIVLFAALACFAPRSFPVQNVQAATLTISPALSTVAFGERVMITANAPDVNWSIVSGGGSISPQGLFAASRLRDRNR
ncbi:hypothetical protein HC891_17750, partial [Candidatus Gracilibacteria bacterium]|nr:hypothetical protein [Candidatus Gracilibacteria bacterium]